VAVGLRQSVIEDVSGVVFLVNFGINVNDSESSQTAYWHDVESFQEAFLPRLLEFCHRPHGVRVGVCNVTKTSGVVCNSFSALLLTSRGSAKK